MNVALMVIAVLLATLALMLVESGGRHGCSGGWGGGF
jgi:hypothetical protein